MLREEIISKGLYTRPQASGIVAVKQYILMRKKGKKLLLLRFENHKRERLDALSFSVKQYDARGTLIAQERFDLSGLSYEGGQIFAFDKNVRIKERCADFKVVVHSATYGNYLHTVHGLDVQVVYAKPVPKKKFDTAAVKARMGGDTHSVSPRTMNEPKPVLWFACSVLLLIAILIGVQLYNFKRTEEFFELDQIEYAFETENHTDGPIRITGYRGNAGNIVIPAEIEGHRVLRISVGAFCSAGLRSVTVEGDTIIEDRAFAENPFLQSVTLSRVSRIGNSAFSGCYSMHTVTLGEGMTEIGANAFYACTSLRELSLPDTIQRIGINAFGACVSLQSATLPTSLVSIGEGVFAQCESMTSLTVPFIGANIEEKGSLQFLFGTVPASLTHVKVTNVDSVYDEMFAGAGSLQSIIFDRKITSIGDGAFRDCKNLTSFEIPQDLETIGSSAFFGCKSLQSIRLPKNLTVIKDRTFYGCRSLQKLELPGTLNAIGDEAFRGCSSLGEIVLPESVKSIGSMIFAECSSLKKLTVPYLGANPDVVDRLQYFFESASGSLESVTVLSASILAEGAFADFAALKIVSLPTGLQKVQRGAFENCTALEEIHLPETVTEIGENIFAGCSALQHLRLPTGLTDIPAFAFLDCTSLKEINIPGGVQRIGKSAFSGCTSLTQADLPSALSLLSDHAFYGCTSLKNIVLPDRILTIPESAFQGCHSLLDVTFPNSLQTIGSNAFAECQSLKTVVLPSGLSTLGMGAFKSCTTLQSFTVPELVSSIGAQLLEGCTALETLSVPYLGQKLNTDSTYLGYFFSSSFGTASNRAIPRSLKKLTVTVDTQVSAAAFSQAIYLEEITLPDGVLEIPASAFAGCTALKTVHLPQSVTVIGASAFKSCTNLTGLVLHEGVTEIGSNAFSGCSALKSFTVPKSVTSMGDTVFSGCVALAELTLPELYGVNLAAHFDTGVPQALKKVSLTNAVVISERAFEGLSYLEEVILDCPLESIGAYAFYDCSALKTVVFGEALTTIDAYAFANCSGLNAIDLPARLQTIAEYAFANCSGLTELTIPDSVQRMGASAFENCNAIEELTLPFVGDSRISSNGLQYIFGYNYPEKLQKVTLTDSVHLPDRAFSDMYQLREIVLPESLETIGSYAFYCCYNIHKLVIPESVTAIGHEAFNGCYRLYLVDNRSSVDLKDDYDTGIRYWALKICQDGELPVTVEKNSFEFLLADDGEWYLVAYTGQSQDLSLPTTFVYGDAGNEVDSYKIANYAFYQNGNLTGVYIPDSVTSIGEYAFYNCYSLSAVNFASASSKLSTIGYYAFSNTPIVSLTLPEGMQTVRYGAFNWCSNLKSVTLPSTLTEIEWDAFYGCNSLEEVYDLCPLEIQRGSTDHGYVAHYALIIHASRDVEPLHEVKVGDLIYKKSENFWLLTGYTGTSTSLTLDSFTYNGETIDSYEIAGSAFYSNGTLKTVTVGDAVKAIGRGAFQYCNNLETVSFEENRSLLILPQSIFSDCHSLKSVTLPNRVTEIGSYAFAWCYQLTTIAIPDSVTLIGDNAFYQCSTLQQVTIGENSQLQTISYYAFSNCQKLQSLVLPATLQRIDSEAFWNCYSLAEIYDLCPLDITAGSYQNGYVAQYAVMVYDSLADTAEKTSVTRGGYTFHLMRVNGVWTLYLITQPEGAVEDLYLPSFEGEGSLVSSYVISDYVLQNVPFLSIVLPTDAGEIADYAKDMMMGCRIYYEGTHDQFKILMGDRDAYFTRVSYYASCVHDGENTWNYDADGKVNTTPAPTETVVIKAPNCISSGEGDIKCTLCKEIWKTRLDPNGEHEFDENGACKHCGAVVIKVTQENFATISYITNDEVYPFAFNNGGNLVPTGLTVRSTQALLNITATEEMTVSFRAYSDSTNYMLYVRLNGRTLQTADKTEIAVSHDLQPGETLTIRVVARTNNPGPADNTAYVKDLQITAPAPSDTPAK